jgi:dolichol-phosphate mannosyltransferase
MDCDLQDQPNEIPKLLAQAKSGFDVVLARRTLRRDNWVRRVVSRFFYNTLEYLSGTKQDPAIANFGIYSQKVISVINAMPETIKYFPTMVQWVGFNVSTIDVKHAKRFQGNSSYSLKKLMNLALDICLAHSDKPIRIVVKIGFLISLFGFLFAAYVLNLALKGKIEIIGYASLIVSIWVLSGLIIFIIGVVGLYVGKSFEGIKKRPSFIVDEVVNDLE